MQHLQLGECAAATCVLWHVLHFFTWVDRSSSWQQLQCTCTAHFSFFPCCIIGNGAGVGAELCVWSVMVLSDGTMVSGDSTGTLQFWDGQHGTLLQAFSKHKADILAVAASKDGNTVFATGIDVQVSFAVLASLPRHVSEFHCNIPVFQSLLQDRLSGMHNPAWAV